MPENIEKPVYSGLFYSGADNLMTALGVKPIMRKYLRQTSKGQSAIEYLMTYGWMLLVVAIVGGAIFATVQNQRASCNAEVPMVMAPDNRGNDGFGVSEFEVTTTGVTVELDNQGEDEVTVSGIAYDGDSLSPSATLSTGSSQQFDLNGVTPGDNCNTYELNVTYSQGGIGPQELEGNVSAQVG